MGKSKHSVEYSINNGLTSPYTYLGETEYISHECNKPISFVWRLKEDMQQSDSL
ncbi:hypothetical protein [Clostridium pasteurianum]|uniref:hypothetical protein n=1 Tax=Clostridium pasteurianum TaxID=1501 RepID=UPI00039D4894|nr:hypothetical protein [Clostridium pasteurianum]